MAESIEYSSIVKFINEDIIQGKLAVQAGGSSVNRGDGPSTLLTSTFPEDKAENKNENEDTNVATSSKNNLTSITAKYGSDKPLVETGAEAVRNAIFTTVPKAKKNPIATSILALGLATVAYYYFFTSDSPEEKNSNALYILGATIVSFLLAGPGNELVAYAKELLTTTGSTGLMSGGAFNVNDVIGTFKSILPYIAAAAGVGGLAVYFTNFDRKLSLSENMANIFGSRKSSGPVSYFFNPSTGSIDVTGSVNKTVVLSSSRHFGTGKIEMKITGSDVTYTINGAKLEHPSYIEGKPVHTALVMAYIIKDRSSHMPVTAVGKADSNYLYSIEDDGSIRLFDNKGGVKGEEIASINMAIRQQLEGNEKESTETRNKVCKKLFGVNVDKNVCASHFYNILGKSALGMLNNMSGPVQSDDVVQALVTAEAHIQYEILKNLDWKMKVSNGNKEMVTVDQWLERLGQDSRPEMKKLVAEYIKYFSTNDRVKSVLDRMVANLNNNTRLLDEKYKEAVSTPQPAIRRKRARLSAAQVANLRSQVLTDNVTLNSPFPVPGRPGVFLSNYTSPFQMGGAANTYENNFANIKQALAAFNQKLSSDTEAKINSKIKEINELDARLSDIHRKINEYTTVLRTEKYPTNISRTVTLSDVENLINQYKSGTQEQTKQVVTLSTAFGKIKMLLEKADANVKPSGKNYMFDL